MKSEVQRLLLRRFARKNSLDGWFLITFTVIIVGLSEAWLASFDNNYFLELAIAGCLASLAQIPIFLLSHFAYVRLRSIRTKIFWQFSVLGLSNLAYTIVFYSLSPNEISSLYTGLVIGWVNQWIAASYLFLVYVFVTGSIHEFKNISASLRDSRERLEVFETTVEQTFTREEAKLKTQVEDALLPPVREISNLVSARGAEAVAIAAKIEDTVKNTVKPLGFELRRQLEVDIKLPLEKSARMSAWGSIPAKYNPRSTLSPGLAVLFFSPVLLTASLTVSGAAPLILNLVQVLMAWLFLHALRILLPNFRLPSILAFCLQQALIWTAIIASSFIGGWATPQSDDEFTFLLQAAPLIASAGAIFTYLGLTEISMERARLSAERLDAKIEDARAVFSQRLWVAKRNWSYLVHGRVQSHLLAAKVLAHSEALSPTDLGSFRDHLNIVMEILKNPPRPDADLLSEILDLETTWRGVAELNFDLDQKTLEILELNAGLRFAVNEVLREAISNAVKHSSASTVDVSIRVIRNELQIEVFNDGDKPNKKASASLGSLMLDELTKSWSLKFSAKDTKTHLIAKLALA